MGGSTRGRPEESESSLGGSADPTPAHALVSETAPLRGGTRDTAERISGLNKRDRREGSRGSGRLRLGKQTLCQLSYSRSGGQAYS
jgi:hypothetical protein